MNADRVVLNVDDHEAGRYARSRLLKQAGYLVFEAGDGANALQMLPTCRPVIVLLDVNLPDMSGLEVCRRIRQQADFKHMPILQITASAGEPRHQVHGLQNGADGYLVEPVAPGVLVATIEALIRARGVESEITESNRALQNANDSLEKANLALLRANEDLNQFTYLATHDLQEPLRTISCFSELLASRLSANLDTESQEYLAHILNSTARMNDLIRALLAFAAAGASQDSGFADAGRSVKNAVGNLQHAIQECQAVVDIGPLPVIPGSESMLTHLFQNLIGNALKYRSPFRRPVIIIRATQQPEGDWLFSVADNGIGVPKEYQDSIFMAFKRLHGREIPGFGIGLGTSRRIVEQMGGRIWVESDGEDAGSTFFFTAKAAASGIRVASP